jgi:hypothetical protein
MSTNDVLEYLEDAYSFLQDPAIGKAIDEIKRIREICNNQAMILRRLSPQISRYVLHPLWPR